MKSTRKELIALGIQAGDSDMHDEDEVWARNSRDKIDIGEVLTGVIRSLHKAAPLSRSMRALSIGSGSEPQFEILESAFRGGLYLLDIDPVPLEVVDERIRRQWIDHVSTIRADYNRVLMDPAAARRFLETEFAGKRLDLVALHHSLYYCEEATWAGFFENLSRRILANRSAIHAVLMASKSDDPYSTTWLYNHFVEKYFGCRNDQDLLAFGNQLRQSKAFRKARIVLRTHEVRFSVDDFGQFMAVIWMILLYPNVHRYTPEQKEEITEHVYGKFWLKKKPLVQVQNHLIVYKGFPSEGPI